MGFHKFAEFLGFHFFLEQVNCMLKMGVIHTACYMTCNLHFVTQTQVCLFEREALSKEGIQGISLCPMVETLFHGLSAADHGTCLWTQRAHSLSQMGCARMWHTLRMHTSQPLLQPVMHGKKTTLSATPPWRT